MCGDSRIVRGWAVCRCIIDDHSSHIFHSIIHHTDRMCGIISGGRGFEGRSFGVYGRHTGSGVGPSVCIYIFSDH